MPLKDKVVGRRKDDVVTDVDLSNLLRKVHPVYSLSNDARLFLAAIVRVLHSEIMKVATVGVTSASFFKCKINGNYNKSTDAWESG